MPRKISRTLTWQFTKRSVKMLIVKTSAEKVGNLAAISFVVLLTRMLREGHEIVLCQLPAKNMVLKVR